MRFTPSSKSPASGRLSSSAPELAGYPEPAAAASVPQGRSRRWAVIHFPCLEGVTPRGELIMVSDKEHIPEARRKRPDLVLWHERELAMFGELMDRGGLDEHAFAAVNMLKLKTRGWFMGVEGADPLVTAENATG